MSLFRQVWLMILGSALLAFIVALSVSTYSARDYLQTQLYTQSSDNATALALSLSQHAADPEMLALTTNALFDSGHFEQIVIKDPRGKVLLDLRNRELPQAVPQWFIARFPIAVRAGEAMISSGWKQAGKVEIRAHSRFAYESLWQGARRLFFWMLLGGVLTGLLMHFVLRAVRQPMLQIMQQAVAISERRFIHVPMPAYVELRPMAAAMNSMVERVKGMLEEQSAQIEQLEKDANHDPVTGLANRAYFIGRLSSELGDEDSRPEGMLYLLRLKDLAGVNRDLGRQATDRLLAELAVTLAGLADEQDNWQAARLNGADFALLAAGQEADEPFARHLLAQVLALLPERADLLCLGCCDYQQGDTVGSLLARADTALVQAESDVANPLRIALASGRRSSRPSEQWREWLQDAIATDGFAAASFDVLDFAGHRVHRELVLRLADPASGALYPAGTFIPFAARFGLLPQLDLAAVRLGVRELLASAEDIAINLSPQSLHDLGFRRELQRLLQGVPATHCQRLCFEVPEQALSEDQETLATFAAEMQHLGVRVGIEHFGRQIGSMPRLYDLQLAYLKIAGSYIHDINAHAGNQQLIKALLGMARPLGCKVYAELVRSEAEWQTLRELALDGYTGPFTAERKV
ncbi:bifunctional diguanylate cyclase/phosphodiesterase [Chitinilyticum piscinae]|uniref:EAL domain-containing protein n=1 Tax=Chitinilyticum piscinae TaxID=2866724 RepID=A0A8J7G0D2_9NEIS|nr:EAL domain-containing protein [Chitinilyticum piscinae]MBE9609023.1 EAL domain-containing protein [Chitinilyticum piscinae]